MTAELTVHLFIFEPTAIQPIDLDSEGVCNRNGGYCCKQSRAAHGWQETVEFHIVSVV